MHHSYKDKDSKEDDKEDDKKDDKKDDKEDDKEDKEDDKEYDKEDDRKMTKIMTWTGCSVPSRRQWAEAGGMEVRSMRGSLWMLFFLEV